MASQITKDFKMKSRLRALADGGRVKGPGGRTDDEVGPVMLSDEEYVLPGDTADAIGRDTLDAIRLATHEFKDEGKKSPLREGVVGLADGGSVPDSRVFRAGNVAGRAARNVASGLARVATPLTGVVGGGVAAKDMYNNGVNAGNTGDLFASAATLGGTPVGLAGAAGWAAGRAIGSNLSSDSLDTVGGTINQGVRNAGKVFGQDWGADDSALMQLEAAERMRPPAPVAQSSTAYQQGRSQPLAATMQNPVAQTPVEQAPASYQSRRLSEFGVPLDVQNSAPVINSGANSTRSLLRTGGTSQYQNLGTYGGNSNIYGKADDPANPGRMNNFTGVGINASPANETPNIVPSQAMAETNSILRGLGGQGSTPVRQSAPAPRSSGGWAIGGPEDRYDKLERDLRGMYSAKGQGNLARKLLELEQLRANEQNSIRSNETSRANTQLSSDTSRANAELSARTNMIDTLSRMEGARGQQSQAQMKAMQDAQRAQQEAMQDAQRYDDERQDKGAARNDKLIEQAFTSNVDGQDVVDRGSIAQLNEFLGSGEAVYDGRPYMSLNPQERAAALPDIINSFRVNQAMNDGGGFFGGGRRSNSPSALRVREAELGDLANGLGIGEYLDSKFLSGSNVVERASDRKVRSVDSVAGDDLERRKAILRNLASSEK